MAYELWEVAEGGGSRRARGALLVIGLTGIRKVMCC
jgi:hypothetical protein